MTFADITIYSLWNNIAEDLYFEQEFKQMFNNGVNLDMKSKMVHAGAKLFKALF